MGLLEPEEGLRRHLDLPKAPMEQDSPLSQGLAGPLLEDQRAGKVGDLLGCELGPGSFSDPGPAIFALWVPAKHQAHLGVGDLDELGYVTDLGEHPAARPGALGSEAQDMYMPDELLSGPLIPLLALSIHF